MLGMALLEGCGALGGGTCRSPLACIEFDESLGNKRARDACSFLMSDIAAGDPMVQKTYNALSKECPDDAYVLACAFDADATYAASGVVYYRADAWTEQAASDNCLSFGGRPNGEAWESTAYYGADTAP
jgi:hypothetical protein